MKQWRHDGLWSYNEHGLNEVEWKGRTHKEDSDKVFDDADGDDFLL